MNFLSQGWIDQPSALPVENSPCTTTQFADAILPRMKFRVLQENLRKILRDRIAAGELTGLRLARQTRFQQAHISNFLNNKRGLSLEGMDKVLAVQHLSVLDLLDPAEVNQRASILPPSEDEFENVIFTDASIAATKPLITARQVKAILKFDKSFLSQLKAKTMGDHSNWQRFVLIKIDAADAFVEFMLQDIPPVPEGAAELRAWNSGVRAESAE